MISIPRFCEKQAEHIARAVKKMIQRECIMRDKDQAIFRLLPFMHCNLGPLNSGSDAGSFYKIYFIRVIIPCERRKGQHNNKPCGSLNSVHSCCFIQRAELMRIKVDCFRLLLNCMRHEIGKHFTLSQCE